MKRLSLGIVIWLTAFCSADVGFDRNGFLLVDGKPYFPVGMYTIQSLPQERPAAGTRPALSPVGMHAIASKASDHDACMKEAREAGFNTTVFYALTTETLMPLLDAAQKNGLRAFVYPTTPFSLRKGTETTETITKDVREKMNHPALLGWYLVDEPEGIGKSSPAKTMELHQLVKKLDPAHPCSLVIMSSKAAADFKDCADVIWTDPYPIPSKPASVVAVQTANCAKAIDGKPLWVVPQAFDWNVWHTGKVKDMHRPTPEEERCMTYLALVNGAKGIIFWAHTASKYYIHDYPEHWEAMKKIASELRDLSPVLLTNNSPRKVSVEGEGIDTMVKELEGNVYLFAVNRNAKPAPATITLDGAGADKAEVMFEGRSVSVESGKIKEEFKPLEVHVYRLAAR